MVPLPVDDRIALQDDDPGAADEDVFIHDPGTKTTHYHD